MKKKELQTNKNNTKNPIDIDISKTNDKKEQKYTSTPIKIIPSLSDKNDKIENKASLELYLEFIDSYNTNDDQKTKDILKKIIFEEPDNQKIKELLQVYDLNKTEILKDDINEPVCNEDEVFKNKYNMKINEAGEYEYIDSEDD